MLVEDFKFLVKDNQLAIALPYPPQDVQSLTWDTKNTLILRLANEEQWVLIHIVPAIRELLEQLSEVMIIFQEADEVTEAYEISLEKDNSLDYEDTLHAEALACWQDIELLQKDLTENAGS